jgi:hypothetical protein
MAAQARALEVLNRIRALHGLSAVVHDAAYDMQTQEASLVQRANNYLNHVPASSDTCYTANAKEGSSTSNLTGGSGGGADPAQHMLGWTNDANNLAAVMDAGHRRWMISPYLDYMSYGQVEGYAALKVFDFSEPPRTPAFPGLEFVAMPYLSYPYEMVSQGAKPTPWSISVVPQAGAPDTFAYFQGSTVSVTDNDTGQKLAVTNVHTNYQGFGLSNFLSWMVSGWKYDQPYTVKISGVRMPGGDVKYLEYPVIIDRYNLLDVNFPLEETDKAKSKQLLQGSFNSPRDQDSYTLSMKGNKTISGASEFSNQAFFIRLYDASKNLLKSSDTGFTANLARGKYTIVVSPCDETGVCYNGVKTYKVGID